MTNSSKNRQIDKLFQLFGAILTVLVLIVLVIFIYDIAKEGITRLDWQFLSGKPSSISYKRAGIWPAIGGTLWIFVLTAIISIPVGVAAGIFFEEYLPKGRLSSLLELNLSNLAGVPSVIYGLLGLTIFKGILGMKSANIVIAGAVTLSLLILPIIIVATREAIKAVPSSLKEASYGLGASKWQTIWHTILPSSIGGIMTGTILALSRAIGETAPLLILGTVLFIKSAPSSLVDKFTVLPMQIFNWVGDREEFMVNASAAIIVLLVITFMMNGIAIYIRNRAQKKIKW
ncbi:phosphate ABC transporter permease PstA [Cyclobacteriaceae bacterium]|nr:phosphate ABC transporter permease PstA [Cyclobacteriaceae bacterium]